MASRFTGLAPQTLSHPSRVDWDPYDDCPVDPSYEPPASLKACTRKAA